jgi:DUF4097 and DUF4098 domain-containing protein YvlB
VQLEVTTGAGHIYLRAGQPGQVRITGTVRGPEANEEARLLDAEPPIVQDGNRIRVGRVDRPEWVRGDISISYEIVAPPETRLWSHTGVGDQRLEGIEGPVDAASSSGRLTLSNIGGGVRARTGVGDIRVTTVEGELTATTSSGSIYAAGITGAICARTRVGHVRLENNPARDFDVSTSSGNVQVSGAQGSVRVRTGVGHIAADGQPEGEWDLGAGAGNVQVRWRHRRGLNVYARTTSGRIETGGFAHGRREWRRRSAGGALVHLRTGVGNIRIE